MICLKKTPFYTFLEPFINKQVNLQYLAGMQHGFVKILVSYSREYKAFVVGGYTLAMSPREFDLIFEITSGDKEVNMKQCSIDETTLDQRRFADRKNKKVIATHLKKQLKISMKRSEQQDIEDIVRIIILHTLRFVLFVACSKYASWWMFRICENHNQLCDYNWGKACVKYLMCYIQSKVAQEVRGCTAVLQLINNECCFVDICFLLS